MPGSCTTLNRVPAVDLIEPATGERLASVQEHDEHDVDRAVAAAHRAFTAGPWQWMNTRQGVDICSSLWQTGSARTATSLRAPSRATSGSRSVRRATRGRDLAADCFEYYAGTTNKITGQTIPGAAPGLRRCRSASRWASAGSSSPGTFRSPSRRGRVAPALAMGNTVVLKPAEQSLMTALRLAELAREAGLPNGRAHGHDRQRQRCGDGDRPPSARAQDRFHSV